MAALADSTTFEAERETARDAYFRLCDANGLDPRTLETVNSEPGISPVAAAFCEAQAAQPDLIYEDWLAEQLK